MFLLLATLLAHAARPPKDPQPSAGAADIPALATLLAQTQWTPTPELSGAFRAGGIYAVADGGHRLLVRDCIAATPIESTYTAAELVSSLTAGVTVRAGLGGGSAEGSLVKKVSFDTPSQWSLATLDLVLEPSCAERLRQQPESLIDGAYVVQELLSARISEQTCGKVDASGRFVGLGAVDAEYAAACSRVSLEPVAVGYRTVPLRRLLAELPADALALRDAPLRTRPTRRTQLDHRGGADFCMTGPGLPDRCFVLHSRDDHAGLDPLRAELDAAGCSARPEIVSHLIQWRRHRTNAIICALTFYGLLGIKIPLRRAEAELTAASRAYANCMGS